MGALDFLMNEIHLVTRRKRGIERENIDDEKVFGEYLILLLVE